MKLRLLTLTIFLISSSQAFAHGGGTDANGCHTNRKTGDYHCHGGGSAKKPSSYLTETSNRAGSQQLNFQGGSNYECGGKTTCGQMSSCAEARFYLNECGISRLDRDSDGVPCETLCGG